jgi:hypothetical protein
MKFIHRIVNYYKFISYLIRIILFSGIFSYIYELFIK